MIVLAPPPDTIAAREAARARPPTAPEPIDQLDNLLRHHTPRFGLWLDTSHQTAPETVEEILARWTEATITKPIP